MTRNINQNPRVSRVSGTTLANQVAQIKRSLPRTSSRVINTVGPVSPARQCRFFQAQQAKAQEARRGSRRTAATTSRGTGQGVKSSGGAGSFIFKCHCSVF